MDTSISNSSSVHLVQHTVHHHDRSGSIVGRGSLSTDWHDCLRLAGPSVGAGHVDSRHGRNQRAAASHCTLV